MSSFRVPAVLAALFSLLLVGPVAAIEPITDCMETADHAAVTYLLIDRSDQLEDVENLKQSLSVLKKMIEPGERLIVGVSTGEASSTRVVMDVVRPTKSLWVSKLKIRAGEKKFSECFGKMQQSVIKQDESHKKSALIETLNVVSKALATDSSKKKRVIVFSDMVQNSTTISFYKQKSLNPESTLKRVEKEQLVCSFPTVEFHVAGAGTGVSDKKARAIEAFWTRYIEKTGGTLKFYGPVLFAS